jgi:hypothetical protein
VRYASEFERDIEHARLKDLGEVLDEPVLENLVAHHA